MSQAVLLFFIIILVSAVVIFIFVGQLQGAVHKGNRGASCLTSMTLRSHTTSEDLLVRTFEGTNEFCPKYQVTFYKKYAEIKLKDKTFDKIKYDELTSEKVNEIIAEEMRYCWAQFGGGKLDAFWLPETIFQKYVPFFGKASNDAIGCRVCSEISLVLEDVNTKSNFTGLRQYLKKHDITKKIQKEGEKGTYYSYLAEHEQGCGDYVGGENCWEEFAKDDEVMINTSLSIDPNEAYLVVFIRKNIKQNEGVMNTYLISQDLMDWYNEEETCKPLPFI